MKTKISKIIRIITIPPFIITLLSISLITSNKISIIEGLVVILFLGAIPVLSYPVNKMFKGNRENERNLAFIFTICSYTLGFLYANIFNLNDTLKFIYLVYFLSVVLLTIINLFFTKASGHMASITGLIIISIVKINIFTVIYTVPILLFTYISSVKLKRHNNLELLLGIFTIMTSYLVSSLLI